MAREHFIHVDTWIFDLDNTLYPAECHLFHQIDARMSQFIQQTLNVDAQNARFMQKDFYVRYGTTLSGLMKEHQIEPEDFLDFVHDIDLSVIDHNPDLATAIDTLPGKKYIFTNGSRQHAENVGGALGILDHFDGIFDIAGSGYDPKPTEIAYQRFFRHFEIQPDIAAMFEDMPQNLEVPHSVGMKTVLVQSEASWFDDEPADKRPSRPGEQFPHVSHVTSDLTAFLRLLT